MGTHKAAKPAYTKNTPLQNKTKFWALQVMFFAKKCNRKKEEKQFLTNIQFLGIRTYLRESANLDCAGWASISVGVIGRSTNWIT